MHYFEDVDLVLFLVALSEYDQALYEDGSVNRLQEALDLFNGVCQSQWFQRTAVQLVFNKTDLFREKLKTSPLKGYFPDFQGKQWARRTLAMYWERFCIVSRNVLTGTQADPTTRLPVTTFPTNSSPWARRDIQTTTSAQRKPLKSRWCWDGSLTIYETLSNEPIKKSNEPPSKKCSLRDIVLIFTTSFSTDKQRGPRTASLDPEYQDHSIFFCKSETPLHIGEYAMAIFIRRQADSTVFRLTDSLTSMLGLQNIDSGYTLLDLGASGDRWKELEPILPSPFEIWRSVVALKFNARESWTSEAFHFFWTPYKFSLR